MSSLFDRTSRVIRANLSSSRSTATHAHYRSQSTNAAKTSLVQICQSVKDVLTMQWDTQRQIDKVKSSATTYHQQAQIALDRGDESSARQSLLRKREQSLLLISLEDKLEEQTSLLELLQSRLTALEEKFPREAQQVEAEFKRHCMEDVEDELTTIGIGYPLPPGGLSLDEAGVDAELEALMLELAEL